LPLDSDDPREKALFEQYQKLYNDMNSMEKQMLATQHKMSKKQAEFF
jgi:ferritin-like metal-binding protein YciE